MSDDDILNKIDFDAIAEEIRRSKLREDVKMIDEEDEKAVLREKVQKIVDAEDMEDGTVVQTHVNFQNGVENADPDYITKVMMSKKEELISTQEMSRILGTTFGNATLMQHPINTRVAPKSPAFKKQYSH